MHLIDGNNVMGRLSGNADSRRQLLDDVARLAAVKKLRLTIVFDGAPEQGFPDGSSYRGVKVFYARQNSDADARIVELVEAERNKKNMLVVTSDGKLAARVRVCGVRVMRSSAFQRLLDDAAQSSIAHAEPGSRRIKGEEMGEEMNEWMRYFGVDDDDNDAADNEDEK